MSKDQSRPDLSLPVLLKSGTQKPAVFLVPGIGGSAVDFVSLAKYIPGSRSIYALQPRGLDGLDSPCDRIEEMAESISRLCCGHNHRALTFLLGIRSVEWSRWRWRGS